VSSVRDQSSRCANVSKGSDGRTLDTLDRVLAREAGAADGVIDLRPDRAAAGDPLREIRIGRMRNLERLGLAVPAASALDPRS